MTTATKRVREELEDLAERVAEAEARAAVAEAQYADAEKHIGWYYRKWAAAETRAKRLESGERKLAARVTALADEADRKVGGDRHDSISGRVTTRDLRRVIAEVDR